MFEVASPCRIRFSVYGSEAHSHRTLFDTNSGNGSGVHDEGEFARRAFKGFFSVFPYGTCVRKRIVPGEDFFTKARTVNMSIDSPHTVGLVGTFEPDANFLGFLNTVATHYHDNGKGLCFLTTLQTNKHLAIASKLLQIKRLYDDLYIKVAISMKHKALSVMAIKTISGQERNCIIAAADEVHVIEEQNLLQLESFVLSQSDTILFGSHEEMDYICWKLNTYGSRNLIWEPRHSNRLHKKRYDRLFYKSFNFIRSRHFEVKTGDLPRELLSAWIAPSNGKYTRYLGYFDQTDILLRLLTPKCPLLPLAVFIYAFTFYDQIWTLETSPNEDVRVLFEQFQTLLRRTAAARAINYKLDFIDIFDFGSYATSLETTAWIDDRYLH